jgi:hypothetical protein
MQYHATHGVGQPFESATYNAFLSALPLKDFSLLAPHLRSVRLERGAVLHEIGDQIEHVYFPAWCPWWPSCAMARWSRPWRLDARG